jgi:hypothetical protein
MELERLIMKSPNRVSRYLATGLISVLGSVASGIAVAGDEVPNSGFIAPAVASKMTKVKIDDKHSAMRWISTDMTGNKYKAIMIDRVIFYPAPDPSAQVSSSVLEQIADYLTKSLRRQIGAHMKVVDKAGPGVLRMQPAMTAVVVKKKGLSAMDILPVHLAFTAATAATGNMNEIVTTMIEVRITDSISKDYEAAIKLGIKSNTQLDDDTDQLTLKDFELALDQGATRATGALEQALVQ